MSPLAIGVIVVVVGVAAVLMAVNAFHKPAPADASQTVGTASSSDTEIKQLIQAVARHIVINPTEAPTVATIQDANLLRTQNPDFYKDAQNGDKLLIWSDKAVLYSPTRDILLAVLPVSLPPGGASSTASTAGSNAPQATQPAEHATIEVRNGSGVPGLGNDLAAKLKSAGLTVLTPTNARGTDYPHTIIVNATDAPLPQTIAELQSMTNAQVVTKPTVEGTVKGDILVIVGADYQK
ncbi:MAG: LytR C-terminal domain-containing protein [Patescibacteria group bacterium]